MLFIKCRGKGKASLHNLYDSIFYCVLIRVMVMHFGAHKQDFLIDNLSAMARQIHFLTDDNASYILPKCLSVLADHRRTHSAEDHECRAPRQVYQTGHIQIEKPGNLSGGLELLRRQIFWRDFSI